MTLTAKLRGPIAIRVCDTCRVIRGAQKVPGRINARRKKVRCGSRRYPGDRHQVGIVARGACNDGSVAVVAWFDEETIAGGKCDE